MSAYLKKFNRYDLQLENESDYAILQQRAERLAELVKTKKTVDKKEYVHFILGENQHYGFEYEHVQGMTIVDAITHLPAAPGHIAGVINWRGEIISVIDLYYMLHEGALPESVNSWVIILKNSGYTVGVKATRVLNNEHYEPTEMISVAKNCSLQNVKYATGLLAKHIVMLDVIGILNDSVVTEIES